MSQQFFYDNQIRRFLTQFIRIVSGFQVEFGQGTNGARPLQQVPVLYGDPSRQAAQILKNNSENTLNSVPAMSVYISALDFDRDRMQDPSFVGTMNIRQRQYDPVTGNYLNTPGDAYTIERLMPVPYKLTLKLDIWTSNTEQKLQLIEQLAQLFNPSLDVQSTDNYVDWGSLTQVELKSTIWDSRSIPANADESISIATMQFEMPVWLSSPAKVKRLGVVTNIINNVYDANGAITDDIFAEADLLLRKTVVLRDYNLLYIGNTLRLLKPNQLNAANPIPTYDDWAQIKNTYGQIRNGISEVRLRHATGTSEIVGTIAAHPTDATVMLFNPHIDTLPGNTLAPVNAIIDPRTVNVDQTHLLNPAVGTRYIITNSIGSYTNREAAVAWQQSHPEFVAQANDIIQFDGSHWHVESAAANFGNVEFVSNLTTNVQYKWDVEESAWTKSVEGIYYPGNWSLVI
jgi:hypothetical protein